LRQGLQALRPGMPIRGAFFESNPPSAPQIVDSLVEQGEKEIVFVPLDLNNAVNSHPDVDALVRRAKAAFPQVRFISSRPIGPEGCLLTVLDTRMRAALSHARCLELDGLVLSSETFGDARGSALFARRARQWAAHHHLPCLAAVSDDSGPSVAQSILNLRSQGRRHIAVGSYFLAADQAYHAQSELAYHYGAVSVSEPIGAAREVLDLVLARYAFAAMELIEFDFGESIEERELVAATA
jgi:sirohydrochlorin ferrochelatase